MKKLLLIALLIVGWENSTEVEDCLGVAGETVVEDCAGICEGTMVDENSDGFYDEWVDLTVEDVDGNTYATIQIDYQLWMVENLQTVHYRDSNDGYYNYIGINGNLWSSSADASTSISSLIRRLNYGNSLLELYSNDKHYGFSIRCLKD